MKGVELPVNSLVIIVMAVIVLLGLIAMYFSGFGPFSSAISLEGIRGEACRILAQEKRCQVTTNTIEFDGVMASNFDANRNNNLWGDPWVEGWDYTWNCGTAPHSGDNLATLSICYYSMTNEAQCKHLCGC